LLKLQSPTENRMNVHKNARLTPRGRERIVLQVESGQTPEAVAQAVGVCPRTVRKWVDRYRREGLAGLHDRSSRPHRLRSASKLCNDRVVLQGTACLPQAVSCRDRSCKRAGKARTLMCAAVEPQVLAARSIPPAATAPMRHAQRTCHRPYSEKARRPVWDSSGESRLKCTAPRQFE